jgi:hypothetical protein
MEREKRIERLLVNGYKRLSVNIFTSDPQSSPTDESYRRLVHLCDDVHEDGCLGGYLKKHTYDHYKCRRCGTLIVGKLTFMINLLRFKNER